MFDDSQPYLTALLLAGLAGLAVTVLPRILHTRLLSVPLVLLLLGVGVFALPMGFDAPQQAEHALLFERLTELAVVCALMACGLKLDRSFSWAGWQSTFLLLGVVMPATILAVAVLGWLAGLPLAGAALLGAVLAPTDPVLATDVQVGPPRQEDEEDEVRFALTAEAGLNDGLAFPFVAAAMLMTTGGAGDWIGRWLAVDVLYRVVVGVVIGALIGWAIAWTLFRTVREGRKPWPMEGPAALAATLLSYALAEMAGGYGFLAVFLAGLAIRRSERDHALHNRLHDFAEVAERLLMAAVLVGLGGAITSGILRELDWRLALVGVALVVVVRPLVGMLSLLPAKEAEVPQRWGISVFGIRGIGSLYYLSYATNHAEFPQAGRIWAAVVFTILVSMVAHGFAAGPFMDWIERAEKARSSRSRSRSGRR